MESHFFSKVKEGYNDWYLYIIGFLLAFVGYFLGQAPLLVGAWYYIEKNNIDSKTVNKFVTNYDFQSIGMDNNVAFFLLILMFAFATLALYIVMKYIHKKNFFHLINPFGKIDWTRFFMAFGIWFLLGLVSEALAYMISPAEITYNFQPSKFFGLLIISLVFLPIQTSFEELLIRGYVMQGTSLFSKNKLILIAISSAIFALMHVMNPEIAAYGMLPMMLYYISAGVFLAIITLMDDRLELALGVHFATNFYGATIMSYKGSAISTDTIFVAGTINPIAMLAGFLIVATIGYWIFSRIYKWRSLSYLLEPVQESDSPANALLTNLN